MLYGKTLYPETPSLLYSPVDTKRSLWDYVPSLRCMKCDYMPSEGILLSAKAGRFYSANLWSVPGCMEEEPALCLPFLEAADRLQIIVGNDLTLQFHDFPKELR